MRDNHEQVNGSPNPRHTRFLQLFSVTMDKTSTSLEGPLSCGLLHHSLGCCTSAMFLGFGCPIIYGGCQHDIGGIYPLDASHTVLYTDHTRQIKLVPSNNQMMMMIIMMMMMLMMMLMMMMMTMTVMMTMMMTVMMMLMMMRTMMI